MAFFIVGAAIVGSSIATAAYGAKQSRKAQKRAREDANQAALIEGSAPNISNVEEVQNLDVQGTQPAGLEEAIAAMDYEAQATGQEVPIPGEAGQNPMGDISEEELMLLIQSPELMGLGAQETQYAASGGAVGTPEDVYYFGVPQIMGMMQDPNPQIQGVGMQLADQMESMPDAGMVPATANQIQTMAMGGAVTAKKFEEGGPIITHSQRLLGQTVNGIENYDPELDVDFIAQQEAFEELLELNGLVDKGVISEARAENDRQLLMRVLQPGRTVSDLDRKNLKRSSGKKANGGPITSERLNQLRRR